MKRTHDNDEEFERKLRDLLASQDSEEGRQPMHAALEEFRADLAKHPELGASASDPPLSSDELCAPKPPQPHEENREGLVVASEFQSDFADEYWQPEASSAEATPNALDDGGEPPSENPDPSWPDPSIPEEQRRPTPLRVVVPRRCAIVLFDGFTALDVVGPAEVLGRVPGLSLSYVAAHKGPVQAAQQGPALVADSTFEELDDVDVLLVPGGRGTRTAMQDSELESWLQKVSRNAEVVAAVCTGALILAHAGLLKGRSATTHWTELETLAGLGVKVSEDRVVSDGVVMTSAGVSAGIDLGLALAQRLSDDETAQAIQLSLEYAPEPLFDAGRPDRAPAYLVERVRRAARNAQQS